MDSAQPLCPTRRQRLVTIACTLAWLVCAPLATVAHAQVIRCTDPVSGKVSYTDGNCPSGTSALEIEARKSPEELQAERERAAQALEQSRERQQADAQRRTQEQQRENALNRVQQAAPDPARSPACMQARRDYEQVQSTLGNGMYDEAARLDAAQRSVDQACLTPEQWAQSQRDRTPAYAPYPYYAQPPVIVRPPYPRPPQPPRPPQKPPEFTHCNVFRCTDGAGNIYPR